jgi:hypothetical protein
VLLASSPTAASAIPNIFDGFNPTLSEGILVVPPEVFTMQGSADSSQDPLLSPLFAITKLKYKQVPRV